MSSCRILAHSCWKSAKLVAGITSLEKLLSVMLKEVFDCLVIEEAEVVVLAVVVILLVVAVGVGGAVIMGVVVEVSSEV